MRRLPIHPLEPRRNQGVAVEIDEVRLEQATVWPERRQVEPGQELAKGTPKSSSSTITLTTISPTAKRTPTFASQSGASGNTGIIGPPRVISLEITHVTYPGLDLKHLYIR
jgi:hypothetical protein